VNASPKDLLHERYGGLRADETAEQRRVRFAEIEELEALLVSGIVHPDCFETVQRRLCELKGMHFDDYDPPKY